MILVTGATGLVGAHLVLHLVELGESVRAIYRTTTSIEKTKNLFSLYHKSHLFEKIEWIEGDILDIPSLEMAFQNIEIVYHCAALISFDPKEEETIRKTNIEGTANVVNLCIDQQIRLLHVSSIAALGNAKNGSLITETDFWEYDSNVHAYAISKYEGEMEVWRGLAEGLNAIIVNPAVIIGKGAGFKGSGAIFKLVKEGLKFYTNGATGIVEVTDVAKCMILLMQSEISGERFTLSAENLHYKDFFAKIAKGFGVKAPSTEAKPWMLSIAWRAAKVISFFTGKAAALTKDAARSSFNLSYYSNEKIKKTIPIQFKPLTQSINEVCEALKQLK